jgi:hypothetical protein
MFRLANASSAASAVFLLLFLSILSLSSLLVGHNISIPTYMLLPIVLTVSFVISRKITRSSTFLTLLITACFLHQIMLYMILPVGWHVDQRVFYIDAIKNFGNIAVLEKYAWTGINYIRFPVPWLIASLLSLISGTTSQSSWLITISSSYLSFILFLLLLFKVFAKNLTVRSISYFIITMLITIYLHRPFYDLIPSSFGVLSLTMVMYFFFAFNSDRLISISALFLIPLLSAHGLAIYYALFYLVFHVTSQTVLTIFKIQYLKAEIYRGLKFSFVIFVGTWLYQAGSQLIDNLIREVPYRIDQLLVAIRTPILERPVTQSIMEQELRVVYGFDRIITMLAYALPILITLLSTAYFLYGVLRERNVNSLRLLPFSIACLLVFLLAAIFAWKGIENAIARYLYVYAVPVSVIVNSIFLKDFIIRYITKCGQRSPLVVIGINVVLLTIGFLVLTESFYMPYASILFTPDEYKFNQIYVRYYAPAIFGQVYNNRYIPFNGDVRIGDLANTGSSIIYTNGYVFFSYKA